MHDESTDIKQLQVELARLRGLLDDNGIEWRVTPVVVQAATTKPELIELTAFSAKQKIDIFQNLFRGRSDAYALRWESKTGKSGYTPACANEWKSGICEKPKIKCSDCTRRSLLSVTEQVIYDHLAGRHTVGIYPLLPDDCCYFLAVDFDEQQWREDAAAFVRSCRELNVPVALEISRSGNGAHAWIFFDSKVAAYEARRLGAALISYTCSRTRQLQLSSYDRLFPNQDSMPKGGFGNLIALPLQKKPREQDHSVFVDEQFRPYDDQWSYLAGLKTFAADAIDALVFRLTGNGHPLDVRGGTDDGHSEPWKTQAPTTGKLYGDMPKAVTVTLANQLYFPKEQLPQALLNRLIRLAAFQNPEFYRAQAMRLPVWDKPRIIACAENFPNHIALPRGCFEDVLTLFKMNEITCDLRDERFAGDLLLTTFIGTLRDEQARAIAQIIKHDFAVLCAPTAFGKTVTAAALIAKRSVNCLIMVHRTELMKQWRERLQTFLAIDKKDIGIIGGGKNKPTGKIDIAVMQSLGRQDDINRIIENYGHVIVDECHHLSAVSFEALLKVTKAKFVLGLTATPIRRDGQQAIIFMQCGPIRYHAKHSASTPQSLVVIPRYTPNNTRDETLIEIHELFKRIAGDEQRTQQIAADIETAYCAGRKILVLTERTEHLDAIHAALIARIDNLFVLHGRMKQRQRNDLMQALNELEDDAPRVLLSTGRLIGEGFDHAALDTLMLAMPVSWKGTLQQYAGRLHRQHNGKTDVRIYDYVDASSAMLLRMWEKRQRGYKAMGYLISASASDSP